LAIEEPDLPAFGGFNLAAEGPEFLLKVLAPGIKDFAEDAQFLLFGPGG